MPEGKILFDSWEAIARTLIIAVLAYPSMLLMIRISGHRTLTKMNAFDLVVTVALGSTLASVITARDVALAQGLVAFAVLVATQFSISWLAAHSTAAEGVINGEPILLFHRGEYLDDTLARERITRDEVNAAVRSQGIAEIDSIEAIVLETNGEISVVRKPKGRDAESLASVRGYER